MKLPAPPDDENMAMGIELCSKRSYMPPPRRKMAMARTMKAIVHGEGL